MNYVSMIGRLTKTPDIKQTTTGKNVCTFTLAVNRRFKDAQGNAVTDFFTVVAWGKLAELCGRYLDKGRKCCVMGELQNRSYETKDGTKRTITEIVAEQVEFLTLRTDAALSETAVPEGFTDIEDEDLPF